MKTKYLNHLKKWSAFTTLNGMDINEFGSTAYEAQQKLVERISKSEFLLHGIKIN